MTIRVAVVGAAGRMGSTVCQAVQDAEGLELVARLDVGDRIVPATLGGAQVAVDFTVPDVTEANVHALIEAGVDAVVGTTGWTEESYARVAEHLARPEAAGRAVLIAPNFALSAVLAMGFAARAARYFESVEVIELHHPDKVDAPSGTAAATATLIARGALTSLRATAGVAVVAALSRFGALGSLAPPAASGTLLILTGAVTRVVTGGAGPIRQVDAQIEGRCGLALLGSAGGRGSPTTARAPRAGGLGGLRRGLIG